MTREAETKGTPSEQASAKNPLRPASPLGQRTRIAGRPPDGFGWAAAPAGSSSLHERRDLRDDPRYAASLRRLARALLAGDDLAQDAVQQPFVNALTNGPTSPAALPSWLNAVLRACAVDTRRSEARLPHARTCRREAG